MSASQSTASSKPSQSFFSQAWKRLKSWEGLLLVILLVVVSINALNTPAYLTVGNWVNLFELYIEKIIIALVMTFIIINAEKVEVTGNKRQDKIYKRHTGYPGGLREMNFDTMQKKHPEDIITHAVKGMMPNGKLGRAMLKKLKVYVGPTHEHAAQKPETWTF